MIHRSTDIRSALRARQSRGFFVLPGGLGAGRPSGGDTDPFFSSVKLLMHANGSNGSAAFTDVKGHTITAGGQIVQRTANPKYGSAAGSGDMETNDPYYSQVSLLMHMDGSDGSTTLTDVKGNTVTAAGGFALDTADKKFGTASGENVSGGRFSFPQSSAFDFGAGEFTIEFWLKATGTPAGSNRIFQSRDGDVVPGVYLSWKNSTELQFYASSNGTSFTHGPIDFAFSTGVWRHIAIVRGSPGSDTITVYVDGTSVGRVGMGGASLYYNAAHSWVWMGQTTPSRSTLGWIDEIRITKGAARYINNHGTDPAFTFTSPTAAFVEQGGNDAPPYFTHPSTDFNLSSGDWTIETWVYPNRLQNQNVRLLQLADGDVVSGISWSMGTDNKTYASFSSVGTSFDLGSAVGTVALTPGAWHHIALTRQGSTITQWINGVASGTTSAGASSILHSGSTPWYWFGQSNAQNPRAFDGLFDDVRVTVGTARYTATFTPPTAQFPDA